MLMRVRTLAAPATGRAVAGAAVRLRMAFAGRGDVPGRRV